MESELGDTIISKMFGECFMSVMLKYNMYKLYGENTITGYFSPDNLTEARLLQS